LEGVIAMGMVGAKKVIFTTGHLIYPFRGHQQSKRPTHLYNHAWAHNGIPEGTVGCLYINAYINSDIPVRWIRMAGHEALANCKIRRMPISQGEGLGVYATEDIEYAQELLMVNREYPSLWKRRHMQQFHVRPQA
jgi:hypothetical protein